MRVKQCWVFTFYRLSSVPLTAGFCNTRVFSINLENPSVGWGGVGTNYVQGHCVTGNKVVSFYINDFIA